MINFLPSSLCFRGMLRRHRKMGIVICIGLLLIPLIATVLAIAGGMQYVSVERKLDAVSHTELPHHADITKVKSWIHLYRQKISEHNEESILLHCIDGAQGRVILQKITFTKNGFTVEGIAPQTETAMAYSEHMKAVLKGVTIHAKQDDTAKKGMVSFHVEGKYVAVPAKKESRASHRT